MTAKTVEIGEISHLYEFAVALADVARPLACEYFRMPLDVEAKADSSPVTRADREIETLLRRLILERYPEHGIFGEEHAPVNLQSEHVWVLDPIDGTKSYISGMPTFGTLIAFLKDKRPQIGVIDMPALNERWVGRQGHQTTFNGERCTTRSGRRLAQAVVYSTSPDIFSAEDLPRYERMSREAGMRRYGGDCYSHGLLASGWIDGVVEAGLQPYDYLALCPVIEGAGGVITDWCGGPLGFESDGRVLAAATPELHAEMLAKLEE